MDAGVVDPVAGVEDVLGAVAVVDIEIENRNAVGNASRAYGLTTRPHRPRWRSALLKERLGNKGCVVEVAVASVCPDGRVVTGGTSDGERPRRAGADDLCGGQGAFGGVPRHINCVF